MTEFLNNSFWNNTLMTYLIFAGTLIVSVAAVMVFSRFMQKYLSRTAEKSGKSIHLRLSRLVRRNVAPILYLSAFYLCWQILAMPPAVTKWTDTFILAFTIALSATMLLSIIMDYYRDYVIRRMAKENSEILLKWTDAVLKITIWCIALILFLDNIGVKITSLITGLGIGGVAIAFAAQTILVDVFCCFTIFFDKPFEVGDFIVTGDQSGTVEHIGIKTTRLRALSGEQIVLANSDLTGSRINNFKRMEERRVLYRLGVEYDTPYEKLKKIPGIISAIIGEVDNARFGRVHFCAFGAYSLQFEVAYYVLSNDYDQYMDINQEINFRILYEFSKEGIGFAFPTQTLQLQDPKALQIGMGDADHE